MLAHRVRKDGGRRPGLGVRRGSSVQETQAPGPGPTQSVNRDLNVTTVTLRIPVAAVPSRHSDPPAGDRRAAPSESRLRSLAAGRRPQHGDNVTVGQPAGPAAAAPGQHGR